MTGGFLAIGIFCSSAFEFFDKLGGINRLSPFIAAWFPNLIFGFGRYLDAAAREDVEDTETLLFWRFPVQFVAIYIDARSSGT